MKISGITVYEVKPRWIFVKITTDEGIEGWGEMISGTKTETVVAGAKEMGSICLAVTRSRSSACGRRCTSPSSAAALSTAPSSPAWRWPCGTSRARLWRARV